MSPFRYILGGWAGVGLQGRFVDCAENELVIIEAPNGTTCAEHRKPYFEGRELAYLGSDRRVQFMLIAECGSVSNVEWDLSRRGVRPCEDQLGVCAV
jgi:hypothetical protein